MLYRTQSRPKNRINARNNAEVSARNAPYTTPMGKRARGVDTGHRRSAMPPETWHEPRDDSRAGYRVIKQPSGKGFRHVVTEAEVRGRLAQLPAAMLKPLQVVQLSQMTRKKQTFPCYGMQWGNAIYLYPMEETLVESFRRPPTPAQENEARMYGGCWKQVGPRRWNLVWTEESIRDFYLNNILLHELGHLLDNRNTGYEDRERYAEWFAIEYGYKASRRGAERS